MRFSLLYFYSFVFDFGIHMKSVCQHKRINNITTERKIKAKCKYLLYIIFFLFFYLLNIASSAWHLKIEKENKIIKKNITFDMIWYDLLMVSKRESKTLCDIRCLTGANKGERKKNGNKRLRGFHFSQFYEKIVDTDTISECFIFFCQQFYFVRILK